MKMLNPFQPALPPDDAPGWNIGKMVFGSLGLYPEHAAGLETVPTNSPVGTMLKLYAVAQFIRQLVKFISSTWITWPY